MLTGNQKRHLKGLGHHLNPVVRVGTSGVTEAVIAATEAVLESHELIKGKLQDGCEDPVKDVATVLSAETRSELVQVIGHTFLLYRRRTKDPVIVLPK